MENTDTNQINLFDIYKEYRSGNKNALNKIIENRVVRKSKKGGGTEIIITDRCLDKMIQKAYRCFEKGYKSADDGQYKKYYRANFTGDISDITMYFLKEVYIIFESEQEIRFACELYGMIKYQATKAINDTLKSQSDVMVMSYNSIQNKRDKNGEELTFFDTYTAEGINEYRKDFCDYDDYNEHKSYLPIVRESRRLMRNYSIGELLPDNANFQKNLINVLTDPRILSIDVNSDNKEKSKMANGHIAEIYNSMYGSMPSESQIIFGLNRIYELFMEYYYGYIPVARTKFKKFQSSFGVNLHNMVTTKADSSLILSAVQRFVYDFEGLGYIIDTAKIRSIAINENKDGERVKFWGVKINDKETVIEEYYYKFDDYYSIVRNNSVKIDGIADIYIVGNCTIVVDRNLKRLYCYCSDKRLRLIRREGNLYFGINFDFDKNILKKLKISA